MPRPLQSRKPIFSHAWSPHQASKPMSAAGSIQHQALKSTRMNDDIRRSQFPASMITYRHAQYDNSFRCVTMSQTLLTWLFLNKSDLLRQSLTSLFDEYHSQQRNFKYVSILSFFQTYSEVFRHIRLFFWQRNVFMRKWHMPLSSPRRLLSGFVQSLLILIRTDNNDLLDGVFWFHRHAIQLGFLWG